MRPRQRKRVGVGRFVFAGRRLEQAMLFDVKLGARTCELTLDDEATIGNLHDAVRAAFDVPEDASLRLLTKGKALPADLAISLVAAGVAPNSKLGRT